MDKGTENKAEWLNPELFVQFLDELRESGYNIGVNQYITVQDLLLTLATQEKIYKLKDVKSLIGPIVCSSANEQVDFQQRFDLWAELIKQKRYSPSPTANKHTEELSEELKSLRKRVNRLKRFLVLSAITILTGVLFYVPETFDETFLLEQKKLQEKLQVEGPFTPEEPVPSPEINSEEAEPLQLPEMSPLLFSERNWQIYLLFPLLFLITWHLWWQRNARLFLRRLGHTQNPKLQKISIQDFDVNLFPPVLISNISQKLRSRTRRPTNSLDIDRMIQTSLERGGWLTPVYGYKKVIPEYLFLIDRVSYQDHQARLIADLIQRLKQNNVYITHYFFDGDAQICYSDDQVNSPELLQVLATRYANDRLVVIAEAENFFRHETGEFEPWVEQIQHWKKQTILTPRRLESWGQWEFKLSKGFVVLPLASKGLEALAHYFRENSATYQFIPRSQALFPRMLSYRPQRWLDRASPSSEEIQTMLSELASYLGEIGFYWFAACAVFPELHWNITIYLGITLKTAKKESLINVCSITDMICLPWYRYGYMPDWLRSSLISKLTTDQGSMVRKAIQALLITSVQGPTSIAQLEIASQHYDSLSNLTNLLLYQSSKQASEGSSFRDYIFLSFMVKQPKLAVKATDNLNQLVQRHENLFWLIGVRILKTSILSCGTLATAMLSFREHNILYFSVNLLPSKAWKALLLVSCISTFTILGLRQVGLFQNLELLGYDQLKRLQPTELPDERVLVITIDETDIDYQRQIYPQDDDQLSLAFLSDSALSTLLQKLEAMKPRAIGLNVYRDYSSPPQLAKRLSETNNLFFICKVPSAGAPGIAPPPEVPLERVGFSDFVLDSDAVARRHLLGMSPPSTSPCQARNAFSLLLALKYLNNEGTEVKTNSDGHLEIGQSPLTRLGSNFGSYSGIDARGYQIFLNYRNSGVNKQFSQVSLRNVLSDSIEPANIRGRIVLVGMARDGSPGGLSDGFLTPYNTDRFDQQEIPGVFIQAHMVSQLISAVLDNRPLIRSWPAWAESLWLLSWAFIGGGVVYVVNLRRNSYLYWFRFLSGGLIGGLIVESSLFSVCYVLLLQGYWVPWIPSSIAIIVTMGCMVAYFQRQRTEY